MKIRFLVFLFVLIWAVLIGRVYYLSIKSNTYYDELAKQNITKTEPIIPIRGLITDRHGEPLAVNKLGFAIALSPHLSRKSSQETLQASLQTIVRFFPNYAIEELEKIYRKNDSPYNHHDIKVVDFIPYETMHSLYPKVLQHNDLKILPATKRYYPNREIASHLIGYVGKANQKDIDSNELSRLTGIIGKAGLEKQYNDFLQGQAGSKTTKVTAFNKEVELLDKHLPEENNHLVLTIDLRLQRLIYELFKEKNGAVIVMDVQNGELLAAGSYPGYDINYFVDGISQTNWDELINDLHHPFTNKLISGLYPPGSIIKPGVALAFLTNGIAPDESHYCSGEMELGGRKFRCWKDKGHGRVDLNRAIRESCDDYFYKTSLKTGIDSIAEMMKKMGFGTKTGIALPNEFIGVVPSKAWKKRRYNESWYQGETLVSSIGQGYFLVTPMQTAVYTALIATGKKVQPKLVSSMRGKTTPVFSEDVLNSNDKSYLPLIQKAMEEVCSHPRGTAYWHTRGTKTSLAGKTGTAQVIGIAQDVKKRMEEEDMEYFHRSHAWLTTYAPAQDPRYAITVMVEHGGHGGSAAGGIITSIANWLVQHGYIAKDQNAVQ